MKLTRTLLGTTVLAACFLALPSGAMAQENAANSEEEATQSAGLNVITVTARRREESLQDAGIAIDAVTGEGLAEAGIVDATELNKLVPSLATTGGGSNIASVYLRGVGNNTVQSFQDPSVVTNLDGVALGRGSGVFGAAFYDLSRVEVLKGPQGILNGRNSTGGHINVIPARPEIGESSASVTLGAGNLDAFSAEGYVNIAIGDNSALRVSGQARVRDGIYDDGTGDRDSRSFRVQYLVEPSNDLSIRLAADYTSIGGFGPGGTLVGFESDDGSDLVNTDFVVTPTGFSEDVGLNSPASNAALVAAGAFPFQRDIEANSEYWGVNAEINYDTAIGTITVIPAYRSSVDNSWFYGPAQNVGYIDEKITQTSLEVRLAGEASIFDYVVGAIYFDENVEASNAYANGSGLQIPIVSYEGNNEARAIFGQLTVNITDRTRLIGGLRYTEDDKSIDGTTKVFVGIPFGPGNQVFDAPFPTAPIGNDESRLLQHFLDTGVIASTETQFFPGGPLTGQNINLDQVNQGNQFLPLANGMGSIAYVSTASNTAVEFDDVTWRLGVEHDLTDDSLLYLSVEEGYRAGGAQLTAGFEIFDPETLRAYTLGSKNTLLGGSLQLNAELFMWEYKDQQVTYSPIDPATGIDRNAVTNVGDADIMGFDIDIIARPAQNTTLSAKIQYLDSEYETATYTTAYPNNNYGCNSITPTGDVVAGGANAGNPIVNIDCSGQPLLFSPEWTLNLGVEQVFPISDDLDLIANVSGTFRDDQFGAQTYTDESFIEAYWIWDASLTLVSFADAWSISGFVRNIADVRRDLFPQSADGFVVAHWNEPRTYGLRASVEF